MSGTARTRAALEAPFARGDKPTAQDVADLLASVYNLTDDDCADLLSDAVTTALFAGIWSGLPLDPATSRARVSTLLARLASAHEVLEGTVGDNTTDLSTLTAALAARPRRNLLINGDFLLWKRATSQTTSGFGSSDRWQHTHNGSSKTTSMQAFTLGQADVPGEPVNFVRTDVTSVAGAANYVVMAQGIEGVRSASGQTVTLSFYAKADAARPLAIELRQNFGSGGGSAEVVGIGAQQVQLTTSWQRFALPIAVPSIAGKVIGSGADDALYVQFFFDAGSNYDTRTDTLGQQSGIFDVADVQLELGTSETTFERLPIGDVLRQCERFYRVRDGDAALLFSGDVTSGATYSAHAALTPPMRAAPTVALTASGISAANFSASVGTASNISPNAFREYRVATGSGAGFFASKFTASAELP